MDNRVKKWTVPMYLDFTAENIIPTDDCSNWFKMKVSEGGLPRKETKK